MYMVTKKAGIKEMIRRYEMWEGSNARELGDVYASYSVYKERAMRRCKQLCEDLGGFDLKIVSHNTNMFTVGFEYPDAETGELMFAYITRDYDLACPSAIVDR